MTRPSRREIEHALDDLGGDDEEDGGAGEISAETIVVRDMSGDVVERAEVSGGRR